MIKNQKRTVSAENEFVVVDVQSSTEDNDFVLTVVKKNQWASEKDDISENAKIKIPLSGYVLKSYLENNYFNKDEIHAMININKLKIYFLHNENELPTVNDDLFGDTSYIFFVEKTGASGSDYFDEYMFDENNGRYELIGNTQIDLSNYIQLDEFNDFITYVNNNFAPFSYVDDQIAGITGGGSGFITTAGTGLSKSGSTLNHANSITAQTSLFLKKFKFDSTGHITGVSNVEKADITALGIPESDTTYNVATTSTDGLMSASDKTKLNGLENYVHPSFTALTGQPTGNATPAFGGSFKVSQVATNANGHVTGLTERTITIPSTVASASVNGLLTKELYTKLNGIEAGATKNTVSNSLTNTSTTDALSAAQGKVLNEKFENYLPLAGGTMTGPLFIPTGNSDSIDQTGNVPISGSYMSSEMDLNQLVQSKRSMLGTLKASDGSWTNVISARHANASGSGVHGLLLYSATLGVGDLRWKQLINGSWKPTKKILDDSNHVAGSAMTGVPTANASPSFGGTFQVSQPVSNASGHITAINTRTITIPSATASTSSNGLMSKEDKVKLNALDETANKGTVSLQSGFSGTVRYYQRGTAIMINCQNLKYTSNTTYRTFGTIPFSLYTDENIEIIQYRTESKRVQVKLTPAGTLQFYSDDASYAFTGQLTVLTDNA